MAKARTLSEAFLTIRECLWDGKQGLNSCTSSKEVCICPAAMLAERAGLITKKHSGQIRNIVSERLAPYTTVNSYLYGAHGVAKSHGGDEWVALRVKIQDYRHAWLVHLSEEFKNESAT